MGRLINKAFDPIQELADDTINNRDFNVDYYCLWDVERLRRIANLIESKLNKARTP